MLPKFKTVSADMHHSESDQHIYDEAYRNTKNIFFRA